MSTSITSFGDSAKDLAKNPLGIIALFIVLVYGFACLLFGLSADILAPAERTPLIWFVVSFPVAVLCLFGWLVSRHPDKLYGPGDYRNDASFLQSIGQNAVGAGVVSKEISKEIIRRLLNVSNLCLNISMTIARKKLVPENANAFVHVINRCVRRGFLCGDDPYSGQNYDHRKQWIVDKVKYLTSVFAIDVAAYAIMSNHYHLVTFVDYARVLTWSDEEVLARWFRLYPPKDKQGNRVKATKHHIEELIGDKERIIKCRERLGSISWFMRNINGPIARRANAEDDCKGHFWEGRFKSKLLLDETALITCMAYVDLNPIRAGMCETLEDSEYTSIAERLKRWQQKIEPVAERPAKSKARKKAQEQQKQDYPWLVGLVGEKQTPNSQYHSSFQPVIAFEDYVKLVEWTGKAMRDDKKGKIPAHVAPVLERLQVNPKNFASSVKHFDSGFFYTVGRASEMMDAAIKSGRQWVKGKTAALQLYRSQDPPTQA